MDHQDPHSHDGDLHSHYLRERRGAGSQLISCPALPLPKFMQPIQHDWEPYADNGGTCAAIAGKGFVIVAGDTRLNGDFNILTREDDTKIKQITPTTLLASSGMQADRRFLQEILKEDIMWFKYNQAGRVPSTAALAQKLSTVLYSRRHFPLYTFNILVGLDEHGDGVCYSYDAVGTTEPLAYGTTGSASSFIEPLMDCILMRGNVAGRPGPKVLTKEEALDVLKQAFTGAAERDIFTGDSVVFYTLTKDGVSKETMPLRRD